MQLQSNIGGWILIGLGTFFLLGKLGAFSLLHIISEFWPLILIAIGLKIVIQRKS